MKWNNVLTLRVFVFVVIGTKMLLYQYSLFLKALEESQRPILEDDSEQYQCEVAEWNQLTTYEVPHFANFKNWATMKVGALGNLLDAEARLLSAFVYHDQISIVTTGQNIDGKKATCRYYDCERNEIPYSSFDSIVAPMTVISCPRRRGAEFVSFNLTSNQQPQEPIPLTFRIYDKPLHELAVCVGPLYGNESKWLEIVEYVEHYKLLKVSFFYFTLFNINEYDRKIIDYYVKLGYAEYTAYIIEYKSPNWMFHLIQTQECHHRSRYHSKWVLNVDIDERLIYTGSGNFRKSIPENVGELSFSTNRVLKTEKNPEEFKNSSQLDSEFMFLKYNKTTERSWFNMKGIIRPDQVFILFYHWSYYQKSGIHVMSVPKRIAHIRHYRNIDKAALNGNWLENYDGHFQTTGLNSTFKTKLVEAVRKKVKYVYDRRWIRCEEIPDMFFMRFGRNLMDCKYKYE